MTTKKLLVVSSWLLAFGLTASAQQRQEQLLSDGWQFSRDKQSWESVRIPHDWAIAGPFDKKWDLQKVAITQNGETEPTEKSGRSGALPWIGEGHYKRTLTIPAGFTGHAELLFDGAMSEPTVFVNGQKAGYWAYGYNTFRVDVTPFVKPGDNLLEVDLQNKEESSRWYPGAGIYRPVTLILTPEETRIDDWGLTTTTILNWKEVNGKSLSRFTVEVPIVNPKGKPIVSMRLVGPDGEQITSSALPLTGNKAIGAFMARQFKLWTPETPYLYKLHVTLFDGKPDKDRKIYDDFGKVIDQKTFTVGIRTVRVSKEKGFELNGVSRKIKGVCLHHDLGPLGAAVNKAALIRQIKMMKAMGCDAIRTSHNMPSQMQMDICDSLGMMVMAESFDMWIQHRDVVYWQRDSRTVERGGTLVDHPSAGTLQHARPHTSCDTGTGQSRWRHQWWRGTGDERARLQLPSAPLCRRHQAPAARFPVGFRNHVNRLVAWRLSLPCRAQQQRWQVLVCRQLRSQSYRGY